MVVPLDLAPQRLGPRGGIARHAHPENSRSARGLPAGMPRASIVAWIERTCSRMRAMPASLNGDAVVVDQLPAQRRRKIVGDVDHAVEYVAAGGGPRHVQQQGQALVVESARMRSGRNGAGSWLSSVKSVWRCSSA